MIAFVENDFPAPALPTNNVNEYLFIIKKWLILLYYVEEKYRAAFQKRCRFLWEEKNLILK